jgi:hypothetical protein
MPVKGKNPYRQPAQGKKIANPPGFQISPQG